MEYEILRDSDPQVLAKSVREYLADGWCLAGGVACDNWRGFAQAVFRAATLTDEAAADIEGKY
jgi:hypothetical protein